jgi:hypothetical protein
MNAGNMPFRYPALLAAQPRRPLALFAPRQGGESGNSIDNPLFAQYLAAQGAPVRARP